MNEYYKTETTKVIEDALKEDWMTYEEWDKIFSEVLEEMGGWDTLANQIEIGIKNGYSFETQIRIVKTELEKLQDE